jgi:glutamine synthetase
MTKRDALRIAREREVRFVRLCFIDITGATKNVTIPVAQLGDALDGKISFDGGSIDGFARGEEIDMLLKPDPSTFAIYPWSTAAGVEARLLCDIANPDGEPFEGDPRTTLQRVIEDTKDILGDVKVGLEIEFYLFENMPSGSSIPETSDVSGYFDLSPTDRGEDARLAIVSALETMGIAIASAHHEHGRGQHEIDLKDLDALAAADALTTMRTVARHVAAGMGLHATFMPKPAETLAGSGFHVYFKFPQPEGEEPESEDIDERTLFAIGGLIAHAPAFTAVCNPTVNSYKRIVAAFDAPIYASWSHRSPNSLVRLPEGADYGKELEIRSPDPSCNPYLALAVLLASAADGIRKHTLPGEPLEGSTYELNERDRSERRIAKLPKSLRQATDELEKDAVVKGALGDHLYGAFRDVKYEEYERYRRAVHPWERDAYLRTF